MKNIDELCTRKQFLIGSGAAAVYFWVAVLCMLNRGPVHLLQRYQLLRNQLITFLTSRSIIRRLIGRV